jgi:RNA polymerase sigma-70 factor (ECF subfamily)
MTCLDPLNVVPDVLPANLGLCDEDLVGLLRAGARDEAMTGIQARYEHRLVNFVQNLVRDQHLAQDVVQEVFERVLRKHALYQPGTSFRAWLFEIARNQALSALRAQKRLPRPVSSLGRELDEGDELLASVIAGPEDRTLEEREFMAAFAQAVRELPEHYRVVFELCVQQGCPYQEAAQRLGMPTGTIAIRVMRARKRLFGALERHLDRLRRPPACFQQAG